MGDTHLGDWGLQMGLVIAELQERHPDWRCFAEDFDPERDPIPMFLIDLGMLAFFMFEQSEKA